MKIDIKEILKNHGFTQNEIDLYLAVLKDGSSNAAELSKALKMDKTSAYRAAQRLIDKGLLLSTSNRYNSKLYAEDITKFKNILIEKRKTIENEILDIEEFIKNLPNLAESEYLKTKVRVYEGAEGVVKVYEERLKEHYPIIREVSTQNVQQNLTPDDNGYWDDYIKRRMKMKSKVHMLIDKEDMDVDYHRTSQSQLKEVRMMPEDFILTAGLTIYGDKVAIHNKNSAKIITVVINDKAIATLMVNFFDFIWRRSTIV